MWNSFRASNAGKGILQCSGMGRYWELSGGLGAWNLETIRVWYLIWSIFWDKWPKFSVWHSFWGPYFCYQSRSGMKPSCLDCFNFYRLGPEFRQNSEHFWKNAQKLDFRLGYLETLVHKRSSSQNEELIELWLWRSIIPDLVVPMNFEWMHEGQAKASWITEGFTLLLIPNIQWKYCMLERIWSYSFDDANRTFSMFLSMAKLGLGS